MRRPTCVLELDPSRRVIAGSQTALVAAIGRGADLRVYTEFRHNEHIDVRSESDEVVREVAEFAVTYLVDDRWAAGIMSLRQPVALPDGFGPRSSMSFFLYNQDGEQAIARPFLDGKDPVAAPEESAPMPRYHTRDSWDENTNSPSSNFVYDFEVFRFYVDDTWEEVLLHDAGGAVQSGSVEALAAAFADGCAVKVGIGGLCGDLAIESIDHEVFVATGSGYYYVDQQCFIAGSHPLVRVRPAIPMRYQSKGWDFGWLVLRTDGRVAYRRCDPYTLAFDDGNRRHPIRWFVR